MKRIAFSAAAFLLMLLMCLGLASPAAAEGTAPIAENLELKTFRHISVGGHLSAYDPDGEVVSFVITTQPVKGDIQLEEDGSFVYTPYYNKKGRDYFGYKAQDADGNLSQEATVLIRIQKQKTPVWYEDMQGRSGAYAAIDLAERGLFVGEQLGGRYCFQPDQNVTKGEFISLSMLAAKKPLLTAVMRTGQRNGEALPDWMKEISASARLQGLDSSGAFVWEEPITKAEASEILNQLLGLYPDAGEGEDTTARACMNLAAVGILTDAKQTDALLTREQAACMISAAAEFVQ